MIIWGGNAPANCYADGGRYNPALNSWLAVSSSLPSAPGARYAHTAVWTGSAMMVWGGTGCGAGGALNDGGSFSPASGLWSYLPNTLANTPSGRSGHTAVWTGIEMIVWGGSSGSSYDGDGGRFNPAVNTWNSIPPSLANAPAPRAGHSAAWTGTQMLVWGGFGGAYFNDTSGSTPGRNLYLYQRP